MLNAFAWFVCLFVRCLGGYLLKRMDNSEILKLIFLLNFWAKTSSNQL